MKLAIPDLISNSYFPAVAAAEVGVFSKGRVGALAAFTEWRGVKLLGALSQGMYWFLVMRADLGIRRGDLAALRGKRIGAAHWVAMGLRRLLAAAGIDADREGITIAPIPGAHGAGINFGVTAAKALEEGRADGVWAKGMGAEL